MMQVRQGLGVHWQGTLQCTLLVISKGVPPIFWAVPAGGTLFFGPSVVQKSVPPAARGYGNACGTLKNGPPKSLNTVLFQLFWS